MDGAGEETEQEEGDEIKSRKRTKSGERVNERESINCALCVGALLLSVAVEVRALTPPAARRDLNQLSGCCIPMQLGHSKACLKLHPHYAHIHTQIATAPVGPLHCSREVYSVAL